MGTIIVLDDEMLIAMDVEHVLTEAGYDVTISTTRSDASQALERMTPDLAIIDVLLTDGDSSAIAETLIARSVPFIVYTGDHGLDLGTVYQRGAYLGKPAMPQDLLEAVQAMLREQR